MKITIDGFFEDYCQNCPEIELKHSIFWTPDNPHFQCKHEIKCGYIYRRIENEIDGHKEENI